MVTSNANSGRKTICKLTGGGLLTAQNKLKIQNQNVDEKRQQTVNMLTYHSDSPGRHKEAVQMQQAKVLQQLHDTVPTVQKIKKIYPIMNTQRRK